MGLFTFPNPANDNGDLYATAEGAYFQVLKARRRHLARDTAALSAERYRQWRQVLAELDDAEGVALAWLRQGRSAAPAGRRPGGNGPLGFLRRLAGRLGVGGRRTAQGRR
ncbi:MAG: hypothetical protein JO112_01040 [Planctomycetes bacterium]|nr:hypothetical protein [Planctomycetota bacterium]